MASDVGEDLYTRQRDSPIDGSPRSNGGLTSRVDKPTAPLGKAPIVDKRLVRFDPYAAASSPLVEWHVSMNDRMEAEEAGNYFQKILLHWGVERENDNVIAAFFDAIMFGHTMNSGSQLQPERSAIWVKGSKFKFYDVVDILGVDTRRFFRAYADEVRKVNRRVYNDTSGSIEARERRNWLIEVATNRGLFKFPDLAHDSSDFCTLIPSERSAVTNSKKSVFEKIINSVDRLNTDPRVKTSDDYDSTNFTTVPSRN